MNLPLIWTYIIRSALHQLLRDLSRKGLLVVAVTHDLNLAAAYAQPSASAARRAAFGPMDTPAAVLRSRLDRGSVSGSCGVTPAAFRAALAGVWRISALRWSCCPALLLCGHASISAACRGAGRSHHLNLSRALHGVSPDREILMELRLPRALLALWTGGALAFPASCFRRCCEIRLRRLTRWAFRAAHRSGPCSPSSSAGEPVAASPASALRPARARRRCWS